MQLRTVLETTAIYRSIGVEYQICTIPVCRQELGFCNARHEFSSGRSLSCAPSPHDPDVWEPPLPRLFGRHICLSDDGAALPWSNPRRRSQTADPGVLHASLQACAQQCLHMACQADFTLVTQSRALAMACVACMPDVLV